MPRTQQKAGAESALENSKSSVNVNAQFLTAQYFWHNGHCAEACKIIIKLIPSATGRLRHLSTQL
jgi:hypothetical protein